MKEKMQEIAFQIIAQVGTAKSMYIEAMKLTRDKKYEEAEKLFSEANEIYTKSHKLHFELVQKESQGEDLPFSLLFMHAEDQMLNTETIKILAEEIMELRKIINNIDK